MIWLDTLLSFVVTMMVLSTFVSAVVEVINGLLNQRVMVLERLMQEMYDSVISPLFLADQEKNDENDKSSSDFVLDMTTMRWTPIDDGSPNWIKKLSSLVQKLRRTDRVQSLTTLEFVKRLAESDVGEQLRKQSESEAISNSKEALSLFLEEIANKFEALGDEATSYYTHRARLLSIFIGIILVFAINFSSVDVVKFLIQSESSRAVLIQQAEKVAVRLNEQIASTEQNILKAVSDSTDVPVFDADEFKKKIDESLDLLHQANLPIGWNHVPWRNFDEEVPFWQNVSWFLSVFSSGLLVGLGGPFWFDTFRKLSSLSRATRVFESEVMQESTRVKKETAKERRDRFVSIFNSAKKVRDYAASNK
ncbi:hypothetical protein [Vibrio natriegens]|uniref:hypothetical protein n=1 Tax=Vibrio natriegens TaxID=691 RepID=UPI00390C049D